MTLAVTRARVQLVAIIAAGMVTAVAWGALWLERDDNDRLPSPAAVTAPSPATPLTDRIPDPPQVAVQPELRLPTIPRGDDGTPRGGLVDVDDVPNTAIAVGAALVRTMWTYDTTIDTTSHDAAARAAPWATDELAAALTRPAVRTSPRWGAWARHDAYSVVGIETVPTPGQDVEPVQRLRTYRVAIQLRGERGYADRIDPVLVAVTLVRERGRWLADGIALP